MAWKRLETRIRRYRHVSRTIFGLLLGLGPACAVLTGDGASAHGQPFGGELTLVQPQIVSGFVQASSDSYQVTACVGGLIGGTANSADLGLQVGCAAPLISVTPLEFSPFSSSSP
jgi:hypothetical protein